MEPSRYELYSTSEHAWQAMLQAISGAQKSIYWELYIFVDDEAGKPFFDVLRQKAVQGVDVKIIVDSFGSFWLSRKCVDSLRAAGAEVLFFNHQRRRGLWRRLWSRTHRKILIVDEEVAFIGGVNISKHMKEWNDIQVRLEGEILYALLRSFRRAYLRSGGKRQNVRHLQKYRRLAHEVRDARVEFIWDDCNPKESRIRKRYAEALKTAKERVILFSPYYFPDRQFIRALWHARRRGVRVDLLLPLRTDVRLATHAAYAYFSLMKKFGVNVFLTDKMMHGKGVIVDDEWAMVGSCNIDQTSFYDNYEASVRIRDKQFVRSLRETMKRWFLHARTLDELKWERRGIWQRCKERVAHKLFEWWHVRRSSR